MKILSRNSAVLLVLAMVFLAPGLAAFYFYKNPQWLHGSPTNQGEFVSPPVLLPSLIKSIDSKKMLSIAPKWHLVLWSPGDCDAACRKPLDQFAQIRLALGRHFYEVDATLLIGGPNHSMPRHLLDTEYNQAVDVVHLASDELRVLLACSKESRIFIANPDGFLVLSYAVNAKPDDVYHDLKQLLTTTQTKSN